MMVAPVNAILEERLVVHLVREIIEEWKHVHTASNYLRFAAAALRLASSVFNASICINVSRFAISWRIRDISSSLSLTWSFNSFNSAVNMLRKLVNSSTLIFETNLVSFFFHHGNAHCDCALHTFWSNLHFSVPTNKPQPKTKLQL